MKRRSKPSRKPVKARPRRASKPKSRNAPKALSRSGSTPAAQETEVARLTRELKEAREQQIATSEVLKVISRSEFDLRAVLENLVEKAVRVCGAERGTIWRQDGDLYRVAASYGHSIEYLERVTARYPIQPDRSSAVGRAILERHSIHIHDTLADPEYGWGKDHHGDKEMHRTMLAVPMLREDAIIGVIAISPIQVKPFTDEQIALVQNFAAQAVIAIENARLLSELRERTADLSQRTADLTESLEQQTATSEVLKVISRSAFDLKVVLDTLLRSAGSLCEADLGVIARLQDGKFYRTVSYGLPDNLTGQVQNEPVELNRSSVSGRALHEGRVVQIADIETDAEYTHPARETGAFRTLIGVPIMREGLPVGVMTLGRRTVQPFTNKQIELVTTFADQAGIAIENARLLNELRDSLEEQTATAEVLQVISSSPGDLKPVFAAMLEKAARICDAAFGNIYRWDGDAMHLVGTHNTPAALAKARGRSPIRVNARTPVGHMLATKETVHIADLAAEAVYTEERDPVTVEGVELGGIRSILLVPMLKENQPIGVFSLYRQEVRPFTDKQIELVKNFAAQAVIAIENARLLNELRQRTADLTESLEQQTATSEVLQVISSTPGDPQPVFAAMLENAARICGAKYGNIYRWDGEAFHLLAAHNTPRVLTEVRSRLPLRPDQTASLGRMVATKAAVNVADLAAEQAYVERFPATVAAVELGGVRAVLSVPMLKEKELVGAFTLFGQEVSPFTEKQITLVANFAAQAVIAIENARLLNELRESLDQQTATAEVLQVISSSQGELEPVFLAMLGNALRICEAKFGGLFRLEGDGVRLIASLGAPKPLVEFMRSAPRQPYEDGPTTRAIRTKEPVQVTDLATEPAYVERGPFAVASVELGGIRSLLVVPMLIEGEVIGVFSIFRQEVRPFTDKQVALVTNFAAQAVIATENARLLTELRESLQQQTATSDVLKVISRSTFDLHTVLNTLVESAARLCAADRGLINHLDGELIKFGAGYGFPREAEQYALEHPAQVGRDTASGRVVLEGRTIHIPDVLADLEYHATDRQKALGYRTLLGVPLLRQGTPNGVFALTRDKVNPFTDKQIELVTTFADQAVIAIENTRLFEAEQQRTRELRESLQEQTATAEVLQVISSSPGDVQPVFAAMLEKAVRICDATFGNIYRWDGSALHLASSHNTPPAYAEYRRRAPMLFDEMPKELRQMVQTRLPVQVGDYTAWGDPQNAITRAGLDIGGIRTVLDVPMVREDELVGAFILSRQEVRPFTEKQIALVTNFARQAVIAIENSRLLKELRERTEEVEKLNQNLEQRVVDQVGEIERMGRLRRFLPPQVADLIVASGAEKQLESHRREITALFCDLRGFTGFSEASAPEDVMALLRDYHAAVGELIIKYSGTLERYAGDGVMVVFNDPVPVDNPALRAVRMALETREALGALMEKWAHLGHDVSFGIGIEHGYATLGTIGFEGRFDYAAIGTVSNVASRLCDEAKPGQILISPRVLMAVKDAVMVEPVGEFELKGIRRPIAACNVLAVTS